MKIYSINSTYTKNNAKQKSFNAHPDFYPLAKKYEIKASSYFRRGGFYGSPCDEFIDVVRIIDRIFVKDSNKRNMLIAGIGDSQEPFSLLAVIKSIIKNKPLNDVVDMNIVDLQSKPKDTKLFEQSYFDCGFPPTYAKNSFLLDSNAIYSSTPWKKFRVKDEIFDFLKQTYNNPKKSHWDSRIQDEVKNMQSESFDIVSINNTLGYINDEKSIVDALHHVMRILKRDGVFITDPYSRFNDVLKTNMSEIFKGIFQKY